MERKQRTIKSPLTFEGMGIHTGESVRMELHPADVDHGIRFVRNDIPDAVPIRADIEHAKTVFRNTTLAYDGVEVHTVEHILASLSAFEIDNVRIELNASEVPIMDGSALPFADQLAIVEKESQAGALHPLVLSQNVSYEEDNQVSLLGLPSSSYRLQVHIDYGTAAGNQGVRLDTLDDFVKEIAPSRTFCFADEIESLQKQSIVRGGDLSNALVVVPQHVRGNLAHITGLLPAGNEWDEASVAEYGVLNKGGTRFVNELARHKLLDLMGDLALLGAPLQAHIIANKPGHKANIAFARRIRASIQETDVRRRYDPAAPTVLDINQLQEIIPHRYPFLLIDRITLLSGYTAIGVKNFTFNEPYFQGHFPKNPILPGVLQVEMMAQVGAVLAQKTFDSPEKYWTYFVSIDRVRFKKAVLPGSTVVVETRLTQRITKGIAYMDTKALVDHEVVSQGRLVAAIVSKETGTRAP